MSVIKDLVTRTQNMIAFYGAISSDTTTTGAIIDTKDMVSLYFDMSAADWTDGTYTMKIEEGDAANLSDAAVISTDKLIYGTLPAISAATAEGATLVREGVHSTKRYVRASIVSTLTTDGATVQMNAVAEMEQQPTGQ